MVRKRTKRFYFISERVVITVIQVTENRLAEIEKNETRFDIQNSKNELMVVEIDLFFF